MSGAMDGQKTNKKEEKPEMKRGSTVRHTPSDRLATIVMLPVGHQFRRVCLVSFARPKPGEYFRPEQVAEDELELIAV